MSDFHFEYWDDYVNPKPGQISIVDALRWRDDIFFINHDRLSGLKPSMKKRIREDLDNGKPAFSVLFEPPLKVVVSDIDVKDIPLPGEEPMRLFNSQNMPHDFKVPLPQQEPEVIQLFNREPTRVYMHRNPDVDLSDIPLPSEPYMENKENFDPSSTCASDSGFSERMESFCLGKKTEKPLQTVDFNFSRETCAATAQTIFTFGSAHPAQNEPIITESLENDINNNTEVDDSLLSEREDGELSDSDLSEIEINFGSKHENRDLSVGVSKQVSLVDEVYLSDSDLSEIEINFGSKHENRDSSVVVSKQVSLVDEVYLSDYEDVEFEIPVKKTVESGTSDVEIDEFDENPCPGSGLRDLETDLASLIQKLETFHLGVGGGPDAMHELADMMTELKIKAEKFHLPTDVVEMLKGLNLDPKNKEEASLLAEEIAKMTISLKQDLRLGN